MVAVPAAIAVTNPPDETVKRRQMDFSITVLPGDGVGVIGEQADERIGAAEVAEWVGTVPHEVLCRTGSRIARVYAPEHVS